MKAFILVTQLKSCVNYSGLMPIKGFQRGWRRWLSWSPMPQKYKRLILIPNTHIKKKKPIISELGRRQEDLWMSLGTQPCQTKSAHSRVNEKLLFQRRRRRMWWHMPVIIALGNQRQVDPCEFLVSKGYIVRPCVKSKTYQNKQK